MRIIDCAWLLLVATLVLCGCQGAPAPNVATDVVSPVRNAEEYKLGSGDQLRVIVFGEEALSGEFVVDGGGYVSLPLIGEVKAEGYTIRNFQRNIESALQKGYLNDPKVSAEVLNYRPYYILGEVGDAGEYPYSDGLTVLNAVATAGG